MICMFTVTATCKKVPTLNLFRENLQKIIEFASFMPFDVTEMV